MWLSCKAYVFVINWKKDGEEGKGMRPGSCVGGRSGSFKCEFWKLVRLLRKRESFGRRKA